MPLAARPWLIVAVALAAGAAGGLVHAGAGAAFTGPYIEAAIGIETQMMLESGEQSPEFWESLESYRAWQRQGYVLASVLYGVSMASLFCIVYALWRGPKPGGALGGAVLLGIVMWGAVFMVPFLKYPATLPGVGDPETIGERTLLYVSFVAVSGASALAAWLASGRAGRARLPAAAAGYAAAMAAAFVLFPAVPASGLPQDLVDGFRASSAVGVLALWVSMPAVAGLLWGRLGTR